MQKALLPVFFLVSLTAFAQVPKSIKAGDFIVNGGANLCGAWFSTTAFDAAGSPMADRTFKNLYFILSADAGYFLCNGFEVGITVAAGLLRGYDNGGSPFTQISFTVGPQVGYYLEVSPLIALFGKAKGAFGVSSTSDAASSRTEDLSALRADLGAAFFFTRSSALELGLYVIHEWTRYRETYGLDITTEFGVAVGWSVFL